MNRSKAARSGWITRRRRLARAAGAPIIAGICEIRCKFCGRNFADEAIKAAFHVPSRLLGVVRGQK